MNNRINVETHCYYALQGTMRLYIMGTFLHDRLRIYMDNIIDENSPFTCEGVASA